MIFKIHLKDPDGVNDSVADAARESVSGMKGLTAEEREDIAETREEIMLEAIKKWFCYAEDVTLEIDTKKGTAKVCEVSR